MSLPLVDRVEWGRDGYALRSMIEPGHLSQASAYWTMRGLLRSIMWRGTRKVVKMRDGFTGHNEHGQFLELLRESGQYGSHRPGSYAGIWWGAKSRPHVPTIPSWQKRYGLLQVAGAWQRAFVTGALPGRWIHYDIRSAYLWSLGLGLPDPTTFRWSSEFRRDRHGMWLIHLDDEQSPTLPYPYCNAGDVLATSDEIDIYGLSPAKIYGGITWDGGEFGYDMTPIAESILRYRDWKAIARSWWGMLMTSTPVRAHYPGAGTTRDLSPYRSNPVWSHLITGRVRMRLWEIVARWPNDVARVYCDSVIVRDHVPVEIGDRVGDWRIDGEYAHGVTVQDAVHITGEKQ